MTAHRDTILFLHPSAELYGADRTLLQLVQGLCPARWCAEVVLPRRGPLMPALEAAGARVHIAELGVGERSSLSPLGLLGLAWRVPLGAFRVLRLARRLRPALIHTNSMIVLGGALGARLARAPHLWHVHEILERPAWLARTFARLFALLADVVVSNSASTRAAFDRQFAPLVRKHSVVLNGVDPPRSDDAARARAVLDLASEDPLVLLPGRINSWKGQELLVCAAAMLRGRHPRARFVILGDAPMGQTHFEEDLDAAIRREGVRDSVRRLPFSDDLDDFLAAADICVVPSTRPEPFGLVAAEAMAHSCPVVAADHGGVAEVVEHRRTGLLVPPGDAKALAQALDELLSDPERARALGVAGRERQRRRFSVARYVSDFAERYQELLGRGAGACLVHVVLGKANPERANGVNRVVHHLARTQAAQGRPVEVWGLTPTPDAPTPPRAYGLRCFRRGPWRLSLDPKLIAAIEAAPRPTMFHLHGGLLPELARAARTIRKAGHAYTFTPHGAYHPRALAKRRWLKRLVLALFDRRLLAGAQRVQALSDHEVTDVARQVPRARIVVVPSGQDPLVRRGPRRSWTAEPVFGFLGRLDAHTKGLDVLLDAFARYATDRPGTLRIIGDGPDRAALEAHAERAGIAERVEFLGARFGREKLEVLSACDAFVHPSRHEGLPGAVLEAAALGLPLVVTAGTGLTAAVLRHRAGLALPDTAVGPVTDALVVIASASAETRRAWSVGARTLVREDFAWERVVAELDRELYRFAPGPESSERRPAEVPGVAS